MYYTKAEIKEKDQDVFTAIASTDIQDRQNEVVDVEGWDLKNFKNNPILLYMHDHMKPLGKATRIWIDRSGKKPMLMFKGLISTATDYGKAAKQLMEEGILNSFSVGFRPVEMDGTTITKAELYEISLVSVPANPEARLLAAKSLQNAGFDETFIKKFTEVQEKDAQDERDEVIAELKEELAKVKELAEVAVKGLQHLAPQRSMDKVASERLHLSKVIAKAADKMLSDKNVSREKAVLSVKVIKRSSEMLIRSHKGDL